jgi:hypothetical protein
MDGLLGLTVFDFVMLPLFASERLKTIDSARSLGPARTLVKENTLQIPNGLLNHVSGGLVVGEPQGPLRRKFSNNDLRTGRRE